jgi:hypothetical protein
LGVVFFTVGFLITVSVLVSDDTTSDTTDGAVLLTGILGTALLSPLQPEFLSDGFSFTIALIFCILSTSTLKLVSAFIVAIALLRGLFEPIIFDKIFENPDNSSTVLTEDQAFNHVPGPAGRNVT